MTQIVEPAKSVEEVRLDQLQESLGFLLRVSQLKVYGHFFKQIGHLGLKPGEFSVLWVIDRNPGIRQGILAQRLDIKNAHMTKLIRSFETRRLVSRNIPDYDRRAVELRLTDEGRDFVGGLSDEFFGYTATLDNPLTPDEQEQLIVLLQKFAGLTAKGKGEAG